MPSNRFGNKPKRLKRHKLNDRNGNVTDTLENGIVVLRVLPTMSECSAETMRRAGLVKFS